MFVKYNETKSRELRAGVSIRPLAFGDKANLCEFRLLKGHMLPSHSHPYEQTGYLVAGKLNFRIGSDWHIAEAGDSWSIPLDVEHEVQVLEDSFVLELFSPVRPDYLPEGKKV